MGDLLKQMLDVIFGSKAVDTTALLNSLAEYSTNTFSVVKSIHSSVVMPIALTILAIMSVLELARASTHVEGDRDLGVRMVAGVMFKLALMVIAVQNVDLILGAINEATDQIIQGIGGHVTSSSTSADPALAEAVALVDKMSGGVLGDLGALPAQIGALLILFIPYLLGLAANLVVTVMVYLRFLELYLLTAFAALPVAFLANPETKSIGVGYLRRYASVALQGAVLMLVLVLYALSAGNLIGVDPPAADASLAAWAAAEAGQLLLGPVVLIILAMSSTRIARALVGE